MWLVWLAGLVLMKGDTMRGFLPLAPLESFVKRLYPDVGLKDTHKEEYEKVDFFFKEILGVQRRVWQRWEKSGKLDESVGDRVACRLGYHPFLIWGDIWFSGCEEE